MQNNLQPHVAIVLLDYNGFEDTINCFESLQRITYENCEIIIVDNASPDASMTKVVEYMREHIIDYTFFSTPEDAMENNASNSKVSLIQSGQNNGYGHGNNIGIKYALKYDADYVLVLNNDTIVKPDFLQPMVAMCENDKNIGIASGKIYFYDRPDTIWFNGGKFSPCTAKVEHFNFNEKDVGQVPKEPVTFMSGCLWLIPKKIFDDVGFINEKYFMYVEDLEFCQRVIESGYKLQITTNSHVWHKVGSSSDGNFESFTVYYKTRNYISFVCSTIDKRWCRTSSIVLFVLRYALRLCKNKKCSSIKDMIKGIRHAN